MNSRAEKSCIWPGLPGWCWHRKSLAWEMPSYKLQYLLSRSRTEPVPPQTWPYHPTQTFLNTLHWQRLSSALGTFTGYPQAGQVGNVGTADEQKAARVPSPKHTSGPRECQLAQTAHTCLQNICWGQGALLLWQVNSWPWAGPLTREGEMSEEEPTTVHPHPSLEDSQRAAAQRGARSLISLQTTLNL